MTNLNVFFSSNTAYTRGEQISEINIQCNGILKAKSFDKIDGETTFTLSNRPGKQKLPLSIKASKQVVIKISTFTFSPTAIDLYPSNTTFKENVASGKHYILIQNDANNKPTASYCDGTTFQTEKVYRKLSLLYKEHTKLDSDKSAANFLIKEKQLRARADDPFHQHVYKTVMAKEDSFLNNLEARCLKPDGPNRQANLVGAMMWMFLKLNHQLKPLYEKRKELREGITAVSIINSINNKIQHQAVQLTIKIGKQMELHIKRTYPYFAPDQNSHNSSLSSSYATISKEELDRLHNPSSYATISKEELDRLHNPSPYATISKEELDRLHNPSSYASISKEELTYWNESTTDAPLPHQYEVPVSCSTKDDAPLLYSSTKGATLYAS